jgi:hypothetical protein
MKRTALLALAALAFASTFTHAAPTARKDFNGDGRADVLWRNATTGDNYLYPLNAKQILASEGYLRRVNDPRWTIAGVGDFNGDGTADLLWRNSTTGENYIYLMNGTTIVAEGYLRTVADPNWRIAGVGDFDGDGKDDILWRNAATGENYIYLMNGTTIVGEGYTRTVSNLAWRVAGVGDTDGDGKADIIWRNTTTGENYVYPMSGTTILAGEGFLRTVADLNWKVAGVADLDGDGKADIVWRNSLTGENYLYPLSGTAILAGEGYIRTVADLNWQIVLVADFDGDGKADILWRNATSGQNYIYFMSGASILPAEGFIRTVADLGWQVLPVAATGLEPAWTASTRISNLRNNNPYQMFNPSVALTSQDVGFVAWNEYTGACGRIWVNRNAGGAWGVATEVGTTQAISPYIAANDGGDALVVWIERQWSGANCTGAITGDEIWGNRFSVATGTWGGPFRISVADPANSTVYTFQPAAVLDSAGRAMVVWVQDGLSAARNIWYARYDGAWSAPTLLSNSPGNTAEPTVGVDAAGNVVAVWVQDTNAYDPSQTAGGPIIPNPWAARFDATGAAWNTPARIGTPTLSGTDGTERPRLAVNAAGNAVAIWRETHATISNIIAASFSPSTGTWTAAAPIDDVANTQYADWPAVAIDAAGNAQAAWTQKTDASAANESGYTARMNGATGAWGAPQLFEQAVELVQTPQVGVDNTGRALFAWRQAISGQPPVHVEGLRAANGFGPQTNFPGDGVALAVNANGAALVASAVTSFEGTFFGISIRAEMSRP